MAISIPAYLSVRKYHKAPVYFMVTLIDRNYLGYLESHGYDQMLSITKK